MVRSWLSKMYEFEINDLENFDKNHISLGSDKQLNYDSKYHSIPFYKFLIKSYSPQAIFLFCSVISTIASFIWLILIISSNNAHR